MPHYGNLATSAVLDFKFTTLGLSGAPQTLAGSPAISVYKTNSTTETTTGVTLTVDFDSRTGLNHVRIDTSADGSFYASGCDFAIVITAGTVDSISAVGIVVGSFSIQNRYQDKTGYTVSTVSDKTGYSLSQAFPTNFSSLSINGSGYVTVVTNNDKTGYTVSTVSDKTGYSLSQTFPANFASLGISAGGYVDADIKLVKGDTTTVNNFAATYDGVTGYDFANCGFPGLSTTPLAVTAGTNNTVTVGAFVGFPSNNFAVGAKIFLTTASGDLQTARILSFDGASGTFTTYCYTGTNGNWNTNPTSGDTVILLIDAPVTLAPITHTGATVPTVTTLTNKTGFSLSQTFPTNFASMAISVGGAVTAGTVSDKTGYSLSQTFPTNFSSLAITGGGAVTAGTVSDKTGYSLSQAFPANFASMALTIGGEVTVGTNNDKTGYTVSTVSDKTGYSLSQTFPTNFSSLAITGGGAVTAGTVSDKTGYSLSQSFPTNFASMSITVGGAVTAGTVSDKTGYTVSTVSDKTGYSLSQAFPSNFASLAITGGGAVTAGTVSDKTGYSLTQTFPTNFASMAISVGGAVTVGTNNDKTGYTVSTVTDKTGYSLSQTFPTNFAALDIAVDGSVTATGGGGGGGASAADVAAAILADPTHKLVTDSSGRVTVGTNADKTGYALSQTFPANFSSLSIDTDGKVMADGVSGGGATAEDVAAAILVTPSQKIVTDSSGRVSIDTSTVANSILSTPGNKLGTDTTGAVRLTSGTVTQIGNQVVSTPVGSQSEGTLGRKVGSLEDAPIPEVFMALQGSPIDSAGNLTLIRGDDYAIADGTTGTIRWSSTDWPDLSKAQIYLKIYDTTKTYLNVQIQRDSENRVYAELTSTQTSQLSAGQFSLSVYAVFNAVRNRHLVIGTVTVRSIGAN